MGLLSLLQKLNKSSKEARLLVLGLDNAGKTTVLRKLADEEAEEIQPTKGFNVKSVSQDGFKLNMFDVGGQQAIRPHWRNYFGMTQLLVYVVDTADPERMEENRTELTTLLEDEGLTDVPLLVFANKQDLVNAMPAEEVAQGLQLEEQKERKWQIQACSAKNGDGLKEGLEWMIATVSAPAEPKAAA